jgi:hypothetical protein
MLFKDLCISLFFTPTLWCETLVLLLLHPIFRARTKHNAVDYHFICKKVLINSDIYIKYISTHNQIVDVFTKWLSLARFGFLGGRGC